MTTITITVPDSNEIVRVEEGGQTLLTFIIQPISHEASDHDEKSLEVMNTSVYKGCLERQLRNLGD